MSYKTRFDRKIFDTKHSIERFMDQTRFSYGAGSGDFKKDILTVIESAMDKILNEYSDMNHTYGIHSKSTGIGAIIDWRQDSYTKDERNHAFIITLLPIRKFHSFKDKDIQLIVEQLMEDWFKTRQNPRLNESAVDLEKEETFSVIFFEGKLYDYSISPDDLIFVD